MGWDLEQFNKICNSKKLPDSRIYQEALFWKQKKVELLVAQSEEVWNNFWQNYKGINTPDDKAAFKNAQFKSETYIEAAAQNLHSMADVLCQIINKVILNSRLHEADVSIGNTIQELQKEKNTQDIVNTLEKLRDSQEFKYIAAFVNTIKHRRLLNTDYYGEFGQGKSNTIGIRFLSFEYEKPRKPIEKYNDTFAEEILNTYIPCVFNLIDNVGSATDIFVEKEIC